MPEDEAAIPDDAIPESIRKELDSVKVLLLSTMEELRAATGKEPAGYRTLAANLDGNPRDILKKLRKEDGATRVPEEGHPPVF